MTFVERLDGLMKLNKVSWLKVSHETGIGKNQRTYWCKTGSIPSIDTLSRLAEYFKVSVSYLLGEEPVPQKISEAETSTYKLRGLRPVVGIVSAGLGHISDEDIIGWQRVDDSMDTDEYFWLLVSGDSMSPMINDKDMVLIHKDAEVASGNIVVAIVDGMEGFLKKVEFFHHKLVLHSFNPYYPDMVFEGVDRERVHIIGRACKVERDL